MNEQMLLLTKESATTALNCLEVRLKEIEAKINSLKIEKLKLENHIADLKLKINGPKLQ